MRGKNIYMKSFKNFSKQYFIVYILIILVAFFGIMKPSAFFTGQNFLTILRQSSIMGIASIGMVFVLIAGGIDLGISSLLSMGCIMAAAFMANQHMPLIAAYIFAIVLTTAIDLVTGFIIVKTGIFAMIGTLAMQIILQGVAYLICGGMPIYDISPYATVIAQGKVGFIPVPIIIFAVVILLAALVLNRTYIGRHFYAVGSNAEAARLSGINTQKLQIISYGISGFLAGLAGIIMLGRINSGQPTAGKNMEMDALTAVVLSGVSLAGGEGKISKAVCGVVIIGVLTNGMTILNISEYYQQVIRGAILLIAVCADGIQKIISSKNKRKAAV